MQLSAGAKIIIIAVDVFIILAMGFYIVYQYSNSWNRRIVCPKRGIVILNAILFGIGMSTGCGRVNTENSPIFNLKNSNYETKKKLLYYDTSEEGGTIVVKDKMTGDTTQLVKDVYRENKEIMSAFYAEGNYAYYLEMTYDKEDKYGVDEYDKCSLVRVDVSDFSTKIIFSESIKSTKKDVFGISKRDNDSAGIYIDIISFLVYENEFCFVTSEGAVYDVNLITGKRKLLFYCDAISLSFMDGSFYYTDAVSRLVRYDMKSGKKYLYEDIVASEFIVNEDHIIYKDRTSGDALTCTDLTGANKKVIYKGCTYFLAADKKAIYYIDDTEVLYEVDFNGKEIMNTQTSLASNIFIFQDYDKIISNMDGDELIEITK